MKKKTYNSKAIFCQKNNHDKECSHDEYMCCNSTKDDVEVIYFDDLPEEIGIMDHYPCMEEDETDEKKLQHLLLYLETIDKRYSDIVMMRLQRISMENILDKLQMNDRVADECEQECRKYFGLRYSKKK